MSYDIFIRPDTKKKSGEQKTMAFVPDPNSISALFIGVAFGLFGLSHMSTLLGQTLFPEVTFMLLRICGYLFVIAALYLSLTE
ncbi:MAG: hypothetical protein LUQ05_02030 [Methanoregula sp.]|nr:hypothetical protein [Methanoregula sp.]